MNKLFVFLACGAAFAQLPRHVLMTGSSDLSNGIRVQYTTTLQPPLGDSQILMLEGGHAAKNNRVQRYFREKNTDAAYGYDLVVDPAGPGQFRVQFEPPTRANSGRLLPLPKYPPPQVVKEGDVIELDVLASPDGRQKLVDRIELSDAATGPSTITAAARDFTLDDGPLAPRVEGAIRYVINGRPSHDTIGYTVRAGATFWFVIPGRGRYILSLSPQDGFQRAGAIRGHVISFQDGADTFEFRASAPILGAGKAWNLYVFHDAMYQPPPVMRSVVHGGVDRLDNLIRR